MADTLDQLLKAAADPAGSYIVLSSINDTRPHVALKAFSEDSLLQLHEVFQAYCEELAKLLEERKTNANQHKQHTTERD